MRAQRYGRIIFISSMAAFTGGILGPHYSASKAGLIGLTHALAVPLAPHGVAVNAVAPALIEPRCWRQTRGCKHSVNGSRLAGSDVPRKSRT